MPGASSVCPLSPVAVSLAKSPSQVPLFPAHSHRQTWHEILLLLLGPVPPGLAQQPVGEGHHLARLVEAAVLVRVLDGVARYATLGVEREDEQAGKVVVVAEVENGLVATQQFRQPSVDAAVGGFVALRGRRRREV